MVEPRVEDIIPFGEYIYYECQYFDTYRLIRMDEPYGKFSAFFFSDFYVLVLAYYENSVSVQDFVELTIVYLKEGCNCLLQKV